MERDILKKGDGHARQEKQVIFGFMVEHRSIFPIVKMPGAFDVSRSGYYSWMGRGPSDRAKENQRLLRLIKNIWLKSGKTYGSPRIHAALLRDGETASRPRVARLMAKEGIQS